MCLKMPYVQGRDLDDVLVELRNGEEWVHVGSSLFRPQSSVLALASGNSTVMTGTEGFSEWRQLPAAGAVSLNGTSAWKLYDANFRLLESGGDGGHTSAVPAGAYLLIYGAANTGVGGTVS